MFFLFQAEDGIRAGHVTGVQTCALPIFQQPQGHARRRSAVQMGYLRIPEVGVYPAPRSRIDLLQGAKLHTSESGSRSEERRVGKEGILRRERVGTMKSGRVTRPEREREW